MGCLAWDLCRRFNVELPQKKVLLISQQDFFITSLDSMVCGLTSLSKTSPTVAIAAFHDRQPVTLKRHSSTQGLMSLRLSNIVLDTIFGTLSSTRQALFWRAISARTCVLNQSCLSLDSHRSPEATFCLFCAMGYPKLIIFSRILLIIRHKFLMRSRCAES